MPQISNNIYKKSGFMRTASAISGSIRLSLSKLARYVTYAHQPALLPIQVKALSTQRLN